MTSTIVLAVANGTLSVGVCSAHKSGRTSRIVKYIANSPAKNISSLESQTIVPTETMLGRVTGPIPAWPGDAEGVLGVSADAVATAPLCR